MGCMSDRPLNEMLKQVRGMVARAAEGGLADAELLRRYVAGRDEAAFEVMLWRHGPTVLSVCRRMLRGVQDVEDAFQATFLTLVKKAARIAKGESLSSWLYKVAYHVCLRARPKAHRSRGSTALADAPARGDGRH